LANLDRRAAHGAGEFLRKSLNKLSYVFASIYEEMHGRHIIAASAIFSRQ
jgi:hypothetical protein